MSSSIEIIGYFFGFWLFIFKRKYRLEWINNFKEEDFLGKVMEIFTLIVSTIIGAVIPFLLLTKYLI